MPTKKTKRCKKQSGGWFWEQSDPIFGKSNKWVARQAGYIDDGLKRTKLLSKIAAPLAGLAASVGSVNPAVGTIAGLAAAAGLNELGYGSRRRRPHGKHMQHGSGSPSTNSNASSFGAIKF